MNVLPMLIALSFLLLIAGVIALFWAVDHDQFDDFETPGLVPLIDSLPPQEPRGEDA
jgi:cbb3-type cytochrome oxidase maturation protein